MNNHQIQLSHSLAKEGYLLFTKVGQLIEKLDPLLDQVDNNSLKAFPAKETQRFNEIVEHQVRQLDWNKY